jgi:hypothetical protein
MKLFQTTLKISDFFQLFNFQHLENELSFQENQILVYFGQNYFAHWELKLIIAHGAGKAISRGYMNEITNNDLSNFRQVWKLQNFQVASCNQSGPSPLPTLPLSLLPPLPPHKNQVKKGDTIHKQQQSTLGAPGQGAAGSPSMPQHHLGAGEVAWPPQEVFQNARL